MSGNDRSHPSAVPAARLNAPPTLRHLFLAGMRDSFALLWSGGWPLLLLILALGALLLAYRFPIDLTSSLASLPSPVQVRGAFPLEDSPRGTQRWTTPTTRIILRGVGSAPLHLRLRFFGGAEAGAGRLLRISSGDQLVLETAMRPDWQDLLLLLPAGTADAASGDLRLQLRTTPLSAPGDPRALGISLNALQLRSLAPAGTLPLGLLAEVLLVVLACFWALRIAGLRAGSAGSIALAVLLLFFSLLAGLWPGLPSARLDAAIALDVLAEVLPLTLLLALGVRALQRFFPLTTRSGRALALVHTAVLLIFTLRLAGVLHPQFATIDQVLRANQLLNLAQGRAEVVLPQLEQQHEWGTREPVPYSVLTYYLLVPLAWLPGDLDDLISRVKLVTVLFDASVPLLLWALLRGGPQRDCGAAWAALVYAALPIGYLFFHDGSFPTTMGVWLVLLALVLLRHAFWQPDRPLHLWPALLAVVTISLAFGSYVTHIAFLPFLGAGMGLSMYILAAGSMRQRAIGLTLAGAGAVIGGWIVFYGSYTLPLVQRTIPAFLGLMASEGAVGRDAERFFDTPLNSFPEHLIAHFRVWPVVLAVTALAILLWNWRGRFISHLGLAFVLLFASTSIAEYWFGLWNKHMYFVAPGIALLAGPALAWLAARGRAGRLMAVLLLAYLFWESSAAWANRVLFYVLPQLAM
jgi:hypothetical protein